MTDTKSDLLTAHEAMASVLDIKLAHLPEWKAFRAIDRALLALIATASATTPSRARLSTEGSTQGRRPYVDIAFELLETTNKPLTTSTLVTFIAKERNIEITEKSKVNISSAFSHEDRLRSIPWQGGRAWWFKDRPIPTPQKESAGS